MIARRGGSAQRPYLVRVLAESEAFHDVACGCDFTVESRRDGSLCLPGDVGGFEPHKGGTSEKVDEVLVEVGSIDG